MNVRNLDNLLKNTLKGLYYDLPEVVMTLDAINYDVVNRNFKKRLFELISEEEFSYIDDLLHSEAYYRYKHAIDTASMSVTLELTQLIDFATLPKQEGGKIN